MTRDAAAPRVSVVTPVFNAGAWLRQTLDSVAAQTFPDWEHVLVDDGSTDPTTRALLEAAAARPGVAVHRTPNAGPARARNLAIERARGAYVLALDADDWLAPTFLARTVAALDAAPSTVGVVHTWVNLVGTHHGVWRTGPFALPELASRCTIHVSSLYRRAVWEQVGGYDPAFVESWEDWDFWLGAVAHGWEGRCVPEALAFYRRTPGSREIRSRDAAATARLTRALVAKHRPLLEAHLDAVLVDLHQRLGAAGASLERLSHHPLLRAYAWATRRLRPS